MVEFRLMIPYNSFQTILSSKETFQINIISKKDDETYAFATSRKPYEDKEVKIFQKEGNFFVIPKVDIKKVEILHVPKLWLDLQKDKLYKYIEGKFSILQKNIQVQVFDDTILRTPTHVLIVNVPRKAEIVQDKGPPIQSNFTPVIFAEGTIDAKHNG